MRLCAQLSSLNTVKHGLYMHTGACVDGVASFFADERFGWMTRRRESSVRPERSVDSTLLLDARRLCNAFLFSACARHAALECERSGDEEKAGGTHRGPPPGPRTAPAQHLLSLLVRLLQVSLVKTQQVCLTLKSAPFFVFQRVKKPYFSRFVVI